MDQRTTTHYTLDKLRDLVMVLTVWPTTMECSLQQLTGTMIEAVIEIVQMSTMEDGGTITVVIQL